MINSEYIEIILELLKKIGPQLHSLKLHNTIISKLSLLELLRETHKLKSLFLEDVQINDGSLEIQEKFKLETLEILYMENVNNPSTVADWVADNLVFLTIIDSPTRYSWDQMGRVFSIQKNLLQLNLSGVDIENFQYLQENCFVNDLALRDICFNNDKAFQSFAEFIKLQKNIATVQLDIVQDEKQNGNNYREILIHLWNLDTLSSFQIACADVATYLSRNFQNTSIEKFVIENELPKGFVLENIAFSFANVSVLDLNFEAPHPNIYNSCRFYNVNLSSLNSLQYLIKLKLNYVTNNMLNQLELPELREFSVSRTPQTDMEIWKKFIKKCPELLSLQMMENHFSNAHLQIILETAKNLNHLEFGLSKKTAPSEIEILIKLVSDCYKRLTTMKIRLWRFNRQKLIAAELEELCPGIQLEESSKLLTVIKK
jgi:hypothetical protein